MLRGLSVLVTRPSPQGEVLCHQIELNGGHTIYFPTIAFAPPKEMTAYSKAVDRLGNQEWLIFISPQAVRSSVPDLRRRWPVMPSTVKFAAIGGGTAAALQEAGYRIAVQPRQEWNSEGLLALPEFQFVNQMHIAVIRGEGGRKLIDHVLEERGADVLPVLAYRRVLPDVNVTPYIETMREHPLSAIVCTSGEAVENLKQLIGNAGWPLIKEVNLVVMSHRVKMLAQDLGFQRICVTSTASNDAILETLAQIRKQV